MIGRFAYISSVILLIILLSGCSKAKNDCMKSTGEIVMEDRPVQPFSQIETHNNVNIILTQGSENSITIEAGANLIDKVTTVIQGDSLVIRNENKCNWVRSYKYDINAYITVKDLRRIDHKGYGKISTTNTLTPVSLIISILGNGDVELNINTPYCHTDLHSSADLILSGYASTNGIWSSGNNWIRCADLVTDTTFIESRTSGDSFINATAKFQAVLKGSGNITYSGNPSDVQTEIIGTGEIIKN